MTKTEKKIRQDSKTRMKLYRAQMIEKGYVSTTVFLSQEHRAELKRFGDEYRLTRAEAAEHIFQFYLQSGSKGVTQVYNSNTDQQAETRAAIESLEVRIKALENQAKKTEETEQDVNQPDAMPEAEDNDSFILELAIEQDDSEDIYSQTGDTPGIEFDVIPDTEATNDQEENMMPEIDLGDFEDNDSVDQEPVEPKQDQGIDLPDYLIGVDPNMSTEERSKIVLKLEKDFPTKGKGSRPNAQKRINLLNAAGVLIGGGPWKETKQFSDQLNLARKRAKK